MLPPINSPFTKTDAPMVGTGTWTKEGEWKEESQSSKIRLKLNNTSQVCIAIEDQEKSSFWQRIKDIFTHIYVISGDGKQGVSLNIASLSKRTHLSIATILLRKITGQLSLEYLEEKAKQIQENIVPYNNIIENGRIRAQALGKDEEIFVGQLKQMISSSLKCKDLSEKLAQGANIDSQISYIIQKDALSPSSLKCLEIGKKLGSGGFGDVYEVYDLTKTTEDLKSEALKLAKTKEGIDDIQNEYHILNEIHQYGHIVGIQDPPHYVIDLTHVDSLQPHLKTTGYLIPLYDFSLDMPPLASNTTLKNKVINSLSLFQGLSHLHSIEIVHGDIKPANCCSKNGEWQLTDFGGARKAFNIALRKPLGARITLPFTSKGDMLTNDDIIMNNNKVLKNVDQLQAKTIELCKKHDVYSLAVTLLCILTEKKHYASQQQISSGITKLILHPELQAIQPRLTQLLDRMTKDKYTDRPTIQEALQEYAQLVAVLQNLPQQIDYESILIL